MRLHGHLCSPEFIPFHETLEKFFKKNFRDEIRRLGLDVSPDPISPSLGPSHASMYQTSAYEQSVKQSLTSTVSTTRPRVPFFIPPLQLSQPAPMSPRSPISPADALPPKQTPLQRHLAHLARHGINGVSSAPGDTGG